MKDDWMGGHAEVRRDETRFYWETLKGRDQLGDLGVEGGIILK
jgi:hypothetical protein